MMFTTTTTEQMQVWATWWAALALALAVIMPIASRHLRRQDDQRDEAYRAATYAPTIVGEAAADIVDAVSGLTPPQQVQALNAALVVLDRPPTDHQL